METTEAQKELVPNTRPNLRDKVFCSFSKMVPIGDLKEHPKNANRHGREQVEILANTIKGTGWRTPIGVSNRSGYIIRGHGRFAAARALGLTHVPVDYQNYETEAQELADLLGDNKIADLSEIDYEGVSNILKHLPDDQLFMTGFRDFEIAPLRAAEWIKPALCDMPDIICTVRFATSEEQGATIRKAIKLCQSKQPSDLTDGQCLELIATAYLANFVEQEKKILPPAEPVPAIKGVSLEGQVSLPPATPASLKATFKIQYVAETTLGEEGVTVVKAEETGTRYYTNSVALIELAQAAKKDSYPVTAYVTQTGKDLWLVSLVKAGEENASVQ